MPDKKVNSTKQKPVHTIRCGEVTVAIYQRQSNAGFTYYDFSLGRCWLSVSTGRESQGSSFFLKNQESLIQAIGKASAWLRERNQPTAAAPATAESSNEDR